MVQWIQIFTNLPTHPKTARLGEELGLASQQVSPTVIATGILISLWTWAIQNAYDGDLSKCSPNLIAEVCRWKKKPEKLVEGLRNAGWLDADMHLHNWEEYSISYIEAEKKKREQARERVNRFRTKQATESNENV